MFFRLSSLEENMGTSEEGFRFVVQFKKDASVQQIKELLVEKYRLLLPQKIHEGRRYVLAIGNKLRKN